MKPAVDLRAERRVRGMHLSDAAAEFGISVSLLSMIERGHRRPSPPVAKKIADAYDTTIVAIWPDFGTPGQPQAPEAA